MAAKRSVLSLLGLPDAGLEDPKGSVGALLDAASESGVPLASLVRSGPSELAPLKEAPRRAKKGPAKRTIVERVVDRESGAAVDIYYEMHTKMFRADVPGFPTPIMGAESGPVISKARDVLRATRAYQWKPSIVVDSGKEGMFWDKSTEPESMHQTEHHMGNCKLDVSDATLAIRFYRCEIAPKPGDPSKFVCRPFAEDVVARDSGLRSLDRRDATESRTRGEDVGDFLERKRATVLPYSPETWAAVQQAAADILEVGNRLRSLLAKPEQLALAGARLLALPASTDRKDD
jgi:hypothetical protein